MSDKVSDQNFMTSLYMVPILPGLILRSRKSKTLVLFERNRRYAPKIFFFLNLQVFNSFKVSQPIF